MGSKKTIAVVGGGFFGLSAALFLAKKGHIISIYEKNPQGMQEASLFNQARVHGGYHYPRSLKTAARCRANYSRFVEDFQEAIYDNFESIYAIAKDSKVSTAKFIRLMEMINAPIDKVSVSRVLDFSPSLISGVFRTEEVAFNAEILLKLTLQQLSNYKVNLYFDTEVINVENFETPTSQGVKVKTRDQNEARYQGVIMATYGLDDIRSQQDFNQNFVYEVCELVHVKSPTTLRNTAITLMDGPFWSLTPWPAFQNHVLTHVKYTPHARFSNYLEAQTFYQSKLTSRSDIMIRDASRYLPIMAECEVLANRYTVKTILKKRDYDDGRPIFAQKNSRILGVLGSKIDNIYEVEKLYSDFLEVI